jgi:predicted DNA-binding transcriptional regulator YafY
VELPVREGSPTVQRRIFLAVLQGLRIKVKYGSVRSSATEDRWLRPHAFGHDGYRWHARAWCEKRSHFADFVLSRIQEAEWPTEPGPLPTPDHAWDTWEILKIKANGDLEFDQRKNIEFDYGMQDGVKLLRVREAMLEYTLSHLRLPLPDGTERPKHLEMVDDSR